MMKGPHIHFREIENYNAGVTMCLEQSCDEPPSMYAEVEMYGVKIHIPLCWKHAEIMQNNFYKVFTKEAEPHDI